MSKNNANLTRNDRQIIEIRDADKVIEMLGEEYLIEYGIELPEELIARWKKNWEERIALEEELWPYLEKQESKY